MRAFHREAVAKIASKGVYAYKRDFLDKIFAGITRMTVANRRVERGALLNNKPKAKRGYPKKPLPWGVFAWRRNVDRDILRIYDTLVGYEWM